MTAPKNGKSRRRRKNSQLPKYVWLDTRGYCFKAYLGRQGGKTLRGPTVTLCGPDASIAEVWRRWEQAQEGSNYGTVRWLLDKYLASPQASALKGAAENARLADMLCRHSLGRATWGERLCSDLLPEHFRKYLDIRAGTAPVAGNREVALFSSAWNWARERGYVAKDNPTTHVRRNKEKARTKYVTDEEYERALAAASPPYLRVALELAYLLRARRGEVLDLRWADVSDSGVLVRRTKGSMETVVGMSPKLASVLAEARKLPGTSSMLVVHDRRGQRITDTAFNTARRRMMKRAGLQGWTGHDLKAKGASDYGGTAKDTGHRSEKQAAVYHRKPVETGSTE